MRVLITGGTGFLGSQLAFRYLADGDEVRVVAKEATDLETATSRTLQQRGVTVLVGDVADESLCGRALDGVELVHHIAAAMREANVPDEHFWNVNVRATQRLLEMSREAGVGRFVYCGTGGVTGHTNGRITNEETECHPKDIYQTTKLAAERAALTFCGEEGLAVSVVRPAGVYGPGDGRLLKLFRMIQHRKFVMVGDGRGLHHLIYIDDLTDGMKLAATRPEAIGRCYNLAGDAPVALGDLVKVIARYFGVPLRRMRLPFGPMKLLSAGVEFSCRPFGIQPPLYRRRLDFFKHNENFSIARARSELGFEPGVSLEEGIARTIEAYRSCGWLSR